MSCSTAQATQAGQPRTSSEQRSKLSSGPDSDREAPAHLKAAQDRRGDGTSELSSVRRGAVRPGQGEARVRLSLTDDVFLHSYTWAWVQLGSPLPEQRRCTQTWRRDLGEGLVDQERTSAGVRQGRPMPTRSLTGPFAGRAALCAWRASARCACHAYRAVRPVRQPARPANRLTRPWPVAPARPPPR